MRQPKTRDVSWLMLIGYKEDDTVQLCLESEGKQRRYLLNGNAFRQQLHSLEQSGFNLKEAGHSQSSAE